MALVNLKDEVLDKDKKGSTLSLCASALCRRSCSSNQMEYALRDGALHRGRTDQTTAGAALFSDGG
jgi:hypothetical protein